jgi:hypothetical protein
LLAELVAAVSLQTSLGFLGSQAIAGVGLELRYDLVTGEGMSWRRYGSVGLARDVSRLNIGLVLSSHGREMSTNCFPMVVVS